MKYERMVQAIDKAIKQKEELLSELPKLMNPNGIIGDAFSKEEVDEFRETLEELKKMRVRIMEIWGHI